MRHARDSSCVTRHLDDCSARRSGVGCVLLRKNWRYVFQKTKQLAWHDHLLISHTCLFPANRAAILPATTERSAIRRPIRSRFVVHDDKRALLLHGLAYRLRHTPLSPPSFSASL